MDSFDRKILTALEQNARQSVSQIAEQVNLSRSAVSERIKRLESQGEILGYKAILQQHEQPANQVVAYLEISHGGLKCAPLVKLLMAYSEVEYCHGVSGQVDLIVRLRVKNLERIHQILAELDDAVPDKVKITTHVVMQQWDR